jgi:hypothetical protein
VSEERPELTTEERLTARQNEMYATIVNMVRDAFELVCAQAIEVDHETLLGQVYGRRWYLVGRVR